jgi:predicted permease
VLYPNAASLVIPIVGFILGEEWVIYTCAFVVVQLCCIWTHGAHMFSGEQGFHWKKILLNPNIVSIAVGVTIFATGLRLPDFVTDVTSSLGGVFGYVAMLGGGMTAATINLKTMLKKRRLYLTVAMRCVLLPLLALVLIRCALPFLTVANADRLLLVSFLASMTPAATTIMQLAQLHGTEPDYAVSINVATTLTACLTMPLFVALYEWLI